MFFCAGTKPTTENGENIKTEGGEESENKDLTNIKVYKFPFLWGEIAKTNLLFFISSLPFSLSFYKFSFF